MRRPFFALFLVLIVVGVLALGVWAFWSSRTFEEPVASPSGMKVAATIFPLYDVVKNIAGDTATVELILPPGASPHTFEVTPRQIQNLSGSKAVFSIGHGLDAWVDPLVSNILNAKVYQVDDDIMLLSADHAEDSFLHFADESSTSTEETSVDSHTHEDGSDPHYFTSPKNARIIARNVANTLATLDPKNASVYQTNLERYDLELEKLDGDLTDIFSRLENKNLILFHDSFAYFARDYGLRVVGVFEQTPGVEPSPTQIANIYELVKTYNVKTIFSEPQLSKESLSTLARDLGVSVSVLDPLGGSEGRGTYVSLMQYNALTIFEALR